MSAATSSATSHSLDSTASQAPAPPPVLQSSNSTRRRTPSTSSRGGLITTDDDEDHDEYLDGDELDEDEEGDHDNDDDPSQVGDALDEATVKSGYLWKKGEKRKVSYTWNIILKTLGLRYHLP